MLAATFFAVFVATSTPSDLPAVDVGDPDRASVGG